jgi:hypothetical protein
MNKEAEKKDSLKELFNRTPVEELPVDFREKVMQRIYTEAAKTKKRNERFGLLLVITASLFIIVLAVGSLIYLDLPKTEWLLRDLPSMPFYLYIGALALLLLLGDYKLRKSYGKRHS